MNTHDPGNGPARSTPVQMVMDHPRQLVDGALLVIMLGFLGAMLSVPHLDAPLHTALSAFVFAILCFIWSFTCLTAFWTWGLFGLHPDAGAVKALPWTGLVTDYLGEVAFAVGFMAIIAHLAPDGLTVIRNACVALILVVVVVEIVALVLHLRRPTRRQSPVVPSGHQPPEQTTTG